MELHLETLCRAYVDGLNTRRLSLSDPVWESIAPWFKACLDFPTLDRNCPFSFAGYLEIFSRASSRRPSYYLKITDIVINVDGQSAQVYITMQSSGLHPGGLETVDASHLSFGFFDGEWLCVRLEILRGIGSGQV